MCGDDMYIWDFTKVEVAGQEVYEVIRIRNPKKKNHHVSDFLRIGTLGLFPTKEEAKRLVDRLNEAEEQ